MLMMLLLFLLLLLLLLFVVMGWWQWLHLKMTLSSRAWHADLQGSSGKVGWHAGIVQRH